MKQLALLLLGIAAVDALLGCGSVSLDKRPDIHALLAQDPIDLVAVSGLLAKSPSSVNALDAAGRSPLQIGVQCENLELARLLMHNGANARVRSVSNETILLLPLLRGTTDDVRLFIEHGADVNDDADNGTPLMWAVHVAEEPLDKIRLLLSKGAKINFAGLYPTAKSDCIKLVHRDYPLTGAAMRGDVEIVKLLLEKGADPNLYCPTMYTPLEEAALGGNEAVVRLLLEKGADPNHANVLLPARMGSVQINTLLIEAGADVNRKGEDTFTALHEAARTGDIATVKVLLAHKADPGIRNGYGETPLDVARTEEIRELLRQHGAKSGKEGAAPEKENGEKR